ncbi:MAG: leucine-rich repeat domain-containing protein [Clostridia bacterium]|nr:leucine-rich repeat domain-containing protein [Clostridia bacterium]
MDDRPISLPGWKIVRVIGKGSFGTVYEVEKDDAFGEGIRSALKIISIPESSAEIETYRDDGYDDESITQLFRSRVEDITAEFRLMNKLKGSSHIVGYEDHMIVQHKTDPGYDVLIRMELLTPLPKYMDQSNGKASADEQTVTKLGLAVCDALDLCQRVHVIHRDIKPQNIFISEIGDFKLGDFGVAKTSDHTTKATKTGTFGYMAPEVYTGKAYNAQIDIYSLGLVMYWMLNERRGPFVPLPPTVPKPSQNAEALERRMSGEPLPAPKNGSEELVRIVLKACAFDPKDRYASPAEMKRDLDRLTFEQDAYVSLADAKQVSVPFTADENEKTFGVFDNKPAAPQESPAAENERTFGVFDAKPSTQQETPTAEEGEKTFGLFGDRSTPSEGPSAEEDEKTFAIFGMCKPKEPDPVPAEDEANVFVKGPASVKTAEKSAEPEKAAKPVNTVPEQRKQPVQKEAKPIRPEPEQKEKTVRPEPAKTEPKTTEKKHRQKNKLPIILSIAAAFVIAAVVLIVVLTGKGKTSSQPAQTAEQPTPAPTVDPVVVFQDETFEKAIREKCGFTGTIYQSDILSVTELNLSGCELTDISDIAQFRNLKWLFLGSFRDDYGEHRNYISDISALSGLTKLEVLILSGNQISDISAVSGLTKLEKLYLGNNQISDITSLSGLTNLTYLSLSDNQISDITALSGLTKLEWLYLYDNQISDITALSGLTNLTHLDLDGNQISDITSLSGLTYLIYLSLSGNQISDITSLSGLTYFTYLSLSDNQISDITSLSGLKYYLKYLYLSDNQISDITALSGLTNLTTLGLTGNPLSQKQIDKLKAKLPSCKIEY